MPKYRHHGSWPNTFLVGGETFTVEPGAIVDLPVEFTHDLLEPVDAPKRRSRTKTPKRPAEKPTRELSDDQHDPEE